MLEIKCGGIEVVITGLIRNQFGVIPRGFESHPPRHDKLTDYTRGVVCQLFILNILNSLCRSGFTAVFLLLKEDHNELNSKK